MEIAALLKASAARRITAILLDLHDAALLHEDMCGVQVGHDALQTRVEAHNELLGGDIAGRNAQRKPRGSQTWADVLAISHPVLLVELDAQP